MLSEQELVTELFDSMAHRQFNLDRLAWSLFVNRCVEDTFGPPRARRCKECERVFDHIPGITPRLFCEPCLMGFDAA